MGDGGGGGDGRGGGGGGGGGRSLTAGAKVGGAETALGAMVDHEDACEHSHGHEHLGGVALELARGAKDRAGTALHLSDGVAVQLYGALVAGQGWRRHTQSTNCSTSSSVAI